jgi:cobalt-zinc-cadmium efflux system outer membrane protein
LKGVRSIITFVFLAQTAVTGALAQAGSQANHRPPIAASLAAPSEPQDRPAPTGSPLTISEALSLAEKNSPLLQEASASVERAQAGMQSARAYTNPMFEFLGGNQSARPITTPGVPGVLTHYSASQLFEIPRERRTRIEASQLDFIGNKYRAAGIQLSLHAYVKRAFYNVIRRKEQLVNAESNLTLVEDLRRRVRLEVEVGEKGKLELTRAEAETARALAAVRSADIELANARAVLKAVIGSPSEEVFDAQGNLGEAVKIEPLSTLRQQVLANHPALSEVNTMATRSRVIVEHEKARRIPEPAFYGEYERQPDISFYRFGVSVPLPLWDRRKGPIAEAKAEVSRADALARQRRLEITSALERAYDQYQISNQQVEGLQAGSLREAQAAVDAAQSAYRFGERGIVEVFDAQRVLQGVRADFLDALYARQSALIDLEELGVTHQ